MLLGYEGSEEIVHRNKICLVALPVGAHPDKEHNDDEHSKGGEESRGNSRVAAHNQLHADTKQCGKQVQTANEKAKGSIVEDDVAGRLAVLRCVAMCAGGHCDACQGDAAVFGRCCCVWDVCRGAL